MRYIFPLFYFATAKAGQKRNKSITMLYSFLQKRAKQPKTASCQLCRSGKKVMNLTDSMLIHTPVFLSMMMWWVQKIAVHLCLTGIKAHSR